MLKYERALICRSCKSRAELDQLAPGVIVVECLVCDLPELWGDDSDPNDPLEYFYWSSDFLGSC